jgi:arylsulfatase A-like enzyme
MHSRRPILTLACILSLAACGRGSNPVELIPPRERLVEATAAGAGREAVLAPAGSGVRLNDVLRRALAAGPPSRLRFHVDIPRDARLTFACAVDPRHHERPGVEFVVKVRAGPREEVVWTRLLDPIASHEDRLWVSAAADLRKHAGTGRELILETRGFEETGDPAHAYWGSLALTADGRSAPLVVVYLVDTLRADHTGVYGYSRPTTPVLDAFAKDAVVFEQGIVHASWTKPSVASILTSLLPGRHRAVQLRDPLDAEHTTIAERLEAAGWSTGAAIANSVIYAAESAFDRGFDFFAGLHGEGDRPSKLVGAEVVVDAALSWLEARRGLPTFLYIHTMDPHVPYAPPPPYDRMFEPHPTQDHPAQDPRTDYREPLDRERMIAQYDGDIAYGDREFGRFIRALKDAGRYEDALIVFVADHGEEFLDHGQWLHGRSVFDELIRVPLLVKFRQGRWAGRRFAQQVQAVDIVPTILESQGLPQPPGLAGVPLQRALAEGLSKRPALAEISHRGFVAHGVRTEADKYVRRFSPDDDELYFDLERDPLERENLVDRYPERVRLMKAQAEEAMTANPFRYVVRVKGSGRYRLRLAAQGWLEGVEATGLGPQEKVSLAGNGRVLEVAAHPRAGQPREVSFAVRPAGAPVRLEGTRDGRPLRPDELAVAESGVEPASLPYRLPAIEAETGTGGASLFAPPRGDPPGVQIWLALPPGRRLIEFDPATRERLKALGYLGPG